MFIITSSNRCYIKSSILLVINIIHARARNIYDPYYIYNNQMNFKFLHNVSNISICQNIMLINVVIYVYLVKQNIILLFTLLLYAFIPIRYRQILIQDRFIYLSIPYRYLYRKQNNFSCIIREFHCMYVLYNNECNKNVLLFYFM